MFPLIMPLQIADILERDMLTDGEVIMTEAEEPILGLGRIITVSIPSIVSHLLLYENSKCLLLPVSVYCEI